MTNQDLRKDIQFRFNGETLYVVAVTPSAWNKMRTDILKIESESFPSSLADNEETLHELVGSPTAIFLAFSVPPSNRLVAYIAADLLEGFPDIPGVTSDPHFGKKDSIYVASVAVLRDWRGCGVGTTLMRQCLRVASHKGIKRATAHIDTGSMSRIQLTMKALKSFPNWYGTGRTFDYVEMVTEV